MAPKNDGHSAALGEIFAMIIAIPNQPKHSGHAPPLTIKVREVLMDRDTQRQTREALLDLHRQLQDEANRLAEDAIQSPALSAS